MLRDCMQISGGTALQKLQGAQRIFRSNGSKELLALIGERELLRANWAVIPKDRNLIGIVTSP